MFDFSTRCGAPKNKSVNSLYIWSDNRQFRETGIRAGTVAKATILLERIITISYC